MNQRLIILFTLLYSLFFPAHSDDILTVYQAALSEDPKIRLAKFKVGLGEAKRGQAGGALLPQIDLSGSFTSNTRDIESLRTEGYEGEQYYLKLTQPIIDLAKYHNWKREEKVAEQYSYEEQDVQQQLMQDVVDNYFSVLASEADLALTKQEVETSTSLLTQIKKLHAKQQVKITELLDAQSRLDKVLADQVEAESLVMIARATLSELTGTQVGQLVPVRSGVIFHAVESDAATWVEKLKVNNPALMGLKRAIESESEGIRQQRAGHLPVVNLQLSAQQTDIGYQNSAAPLTKTRVAALTFNVPIYSGGVTSKRVTEAAHRLNMAKYRYESEFRRLKKEVTEALLRTNLSVKRLAASKTALKSANEAYLSMKKGFKYGVVSLSDVLDRQQALYQVKHDYQKLGYDYIQNRTKLMRVVGLMDEEKLMQINDWLKGQS